MEDPTLKASQQPLVPKEPPSKDLDKWTIGQPLSNMRPSHLWACLGAIFALVIGAFALGHKLAVKSSTAESPTVEFATAYTTRSLEECGNAAHDELALA